MTATAQDIAEPPDEEAPSLVISQTALDLNRRQVELGLKRLELLKSVKDKASAEAAADKLRECEHTWQMLDAEREDTVPYEETLALLFINVDDAEEEGVMDEVYRIKDLKFYGSETLEKVMREGFPYLDAARIQLPLKEATGHDLMTWRLSAMGLIYLVKDKASADEVAAKLTALQKKEEKAFADSGMTAEEFAQFKLDYYDQDTVLEDHKGLQKERLEKADYFGSTALKKAYEFWSKRYP